MQQSYYNNRIVLVIVLDLCRFAFHNRKQTEIARERKRDMICVIFVAGHGTTLETELKEEGDSEFANLVGVPKALLPGVGGQPILTLWWAALREGHIFEKVYLVSNADKYKYYERWATANDFPTENLINDGTTTHAGR